MYVIPDFILWEADEEEEESQPVRRGKNAKNCY